MSSPFDRGLPAADAGPGRFTDAAVDPQAGDEERVIESALRPHSLTDFIGQPKVARQLELVLEGAKRRGRPPDHVLLSGPPGLGKTSLALIIGSELGTSVKITRGPAIERSGDLAAMLSNLAPGDVLFIDEIHRIARAAEGLLYMAMEDFRVDVVVGKGPGATAIPLEINPFTLVGATTRAGLLTGPLRDRFGFVGQMEFYEPAELERVLARSAALLGVELTADGSAEIAGRSRGTPRIRSGPGATAIPLEINPFPLVGATTRAGRLTGPLRDRFGFVGQMEFYEPAELERVLARSAALLGVELTADGSAEIAGRSRDTPRIANRLLRRVRDYAEVRADGRVTRAVAEIG